MTQRTAIRLAWGSVVASLLLYVLLEAFALMTPADTVPPTVRSQVGLTQHLFSWSFLPFILVGALVATRQRRNAVGWLLVIIGLSIVVNGIAKTYGMYALFVHPGLPAGVWGVWLAKWEWLAAGTLLLAPLPLLFPDGKLISPRWRIVIWLSIAGPGLTVLIGVLDPTYLAEYRQANPTAVSGLTNSMRLASSLGLAALGITPILSTLGVIQRYRRADFEQRQQIKWFASAVALMALILAGQVAASAMFNVQAYTHAIFNLLSAAAIAALPAAIGFAVLKYRLYDIDVVINKALVYGGLAAFITAVYVAVVVGAGALVGTGGQLNLALSILATAVVAVAFQPVRERVQRVANRLVFGVRATPYEVMADFAERMAGALSLSDVLPKMAEAAAAGVGARQARVRLFLADGREQVAIWPQDSPGAAFDFVLPATYRSDRLGEIGVATAGHEPLTPTERKLLSDVATQAGLVLHNVRLAIELQQRLEESATTSAAIRASRQRIMAAQDTERRRLEETIREGTEAQLGSIKAELERIEQTLTSDPVSAASLLQQLASRATETLEGLRDLARGIYPPLLREKGLVPALHAQLDKMRLPAEVRGAVSGRYPSEAEAAVYFACLEALRSATAPASVDIQPADASLAFVVRAARLNLDGRIQEIEDRIEALGGSIALRDRELSGRVPAGVLEAV